MKRLVLRLSTVACLATLAFLVPRPGDADSNPHPDKLVILATTDVKGKTGPCGCHVPKGGLSRRAFFRDSVAKIYGQVSLVDNGGFVPTEDTHEEEGWFLMDAMKKLGIDAVGTAANDLRFGYANLKTHVANTQLPVTSANLIDVAAKRPAFDPYVIRTVGKVKVGYFSLMDPKTDLGPAKDSLRVDDPTATAKKTVAELRKQGATVVVLLSQIGNVESEDLVTMVPGIDAVIIGRNSPVLAQGRLFNSTIAAYPGEQGHYLAETTLTLNAAGKVTARESGTVQLGPEVADRADMLDMVKTFNTAFNEKLKTLEKDNPSEGTLGHPQAASTGGH
jgi:2',3'-cyclic-nucleotide 2'-phosphodiesterase (5'-nucleotidase family)